MLHWLHRQLGYEDTHELLRDTRKLDEGFDGNGRSLICTHLTTRSKQLHGLTVEDLQRYDDNIREHLKCMNRGRPEPIVLRYFQYLAALYSEIFLDQYSNRRKSLLLSLNEFVSKHISISSTSRQYETFAESDLSKLAFWMATGSGKTLLLHLNYLQFIHYNRKPLDNILLITPNEGLSQQHLDELRASNISARRFDIDGVGDSLSPKATISVTEITKLVEVKRGGGVRVPVENFEGNNLIFVDEGHKGAGGEAWRGLRDALAETGFTFEYSATFGQALAAAKNDELLAEYGKSIVFDYSYRHFYEDGYGKDFNILNLQKVTSGRQTDTLLMANLLSFYEQQTVFARESDELKLYHLSRPLWAFIGGSVNAVFSENGKNRSDILTVVSFLQRVLSDRSWSVSTIDRLLNGDSRLRHANGRDVFENKFEYLRRHEPDAETIYWNALGKIMHTEGGGLQLLDLRGCEGELGIKSAGAEDYFGVIYIGDTSKFKKLVHENVHGIEVGDDLLHTSLFDEINEPDSTVEILAGARKFIEGWDSWRVSNMGLLNIGRSEGSLIIQLFGRGVRLKGRGMSLKRSSALNDEIHPSDIKLLETLNIFALRADYMSKFREYLKSEGILAHETIDLPLFIQADNGFLDKGLLIPRIDEERKFVREETVLLQHQKNMKPVSVEMSTRVQEIASTQSGITDLEATSGIERTIPRHILGLVDWESVHLALLEHKESRKMSNLLVRPDLLRPILEYSPKAYRLIAEQSIVEPKKFQERELLQEVVVNILRKYADSLYRHHLAQWETENLAYRKLDHGDSNFRFNFAEEENKGSYVVRVPRDKEALIERVEKLIEECSHIYENERDDLPRIHFEKHLYQPLLVEADGVTSSPPGLQGSESRFVADLRDYCRDSQAEFAPGTELYLLRNLSRGHGVGFFKNRGFYPDFILWIKTECRQRIVFIEPHGMLYQRAFAKDEKVQLHEDLQELSRKIASRSGDSHVQLDSYIISATKFKDLQDYYSDGFWTEDDFAAKHILFQEPEVGYNYIERILQLK